MALIVNSYPINIFFSFFFAFSLRIRDILEISLILISLLYFYLCPIICSTYLQIVNNTSSIKIRSKNDFDT